MRNAPPHQRLVPVSLLATMLAAASLSGAAQEGFRFKSAAALVSVTATVSDENGRFVSGLQKRDFTIFDNNVPVSIEQFSSDRVPVSLGIALDSSGSMTSEKMAAARAAIDRFIFDLLGPDDELFLVEFANTARVLQDWTLDRRAISRALARIDPAGGTAMYDAIAEALPLAAAGRHQKKAILVISDGNDTNSRISVRELRQAIRESEVLVYALGVDGTASNRGRIQVPTQPRFPIPLPFPPTGRPRGRFPQIVNGPTWGSNNGERVNADALRQITDDTGGRTEIVRGFGDLDAATARIADELSKQYFLGYPMDAPDGKWHSIRVEVRDKRYVVRARKGYFAS